MNFVNNSYPNLVATQSLNYTYVSTATPEKAFPETVADTRAVEVHIQSAPARSTKERKELSKKLFFKQR